MSESDTQLTSDLCIPFAYPTAHVGRHIPMEDDHFDLSEFNFHDGTRVITYTAKKEDEKLEGLMEVVVFIERSGFHTRINECLPPGFNLYQIRDEFSGFLNCPISFFPLEKGIIFANFSFDLHSFQQTGSPIFSQCSSVAFLLHEICHAQIENFDQARSNFGDHLLSLRDEGTLSFADSSTLHRYKNIIIGDEVMCWEYTKTALLKLQQQGLDVTQIFTISEIIEFSRRAIKGYGFIPSAAPERNRQYFDVDDNGNIIQV